MIKDIYILLCYDELWNSSTPVTLYIGIFLR